MNLYIAFITGLTAGGVGCLAVQGALLTCAVVQRGELGPPGEPPLLPRSRTGAPIVLFLLSRLAAYTLLGIMLGACGSMLQLSPLLRAAMMIAVGLFTLGNGLRLLELHPVFRWFVLQPPHGVSRFLSRLPKRGGVLQNPAILGALTVLLPCGVAQTMMAAALAGGDACHGAAILFCYTLGTTPLLFAAAFGAARLGSIAQHLFARGTAVLMILLGLTSITLGGNLAGAGITLPVWPSPATAVSSPPPAPPGGAYSIAVSDDGYSPRVLHLPAGRPVRLHWIVGGAPCCAQSVVIPALHVQKVLAGATTSDLTVPPQREGTVIDYTCSMGRRTGRLVFDLHPVSPEE